jgi:hypothetical protein
MWVNQTKSPSYAQSPFAVVHEHDYSDGSIGYATYFMPGSEIGDFIGPAFVKFASDEQVALATPHERLHLRQLQKGHDGAVKQGWDAWVAGAKHDAPHVKSWTATWSPDSRMNLNGIGVYNPRVGDPLPQNAHGSLFAQSLRNLKLAVSHVDAATKKRDINCAWSEKWQTMVQLVRVPIGSKPVQALVSYGNDLNLKMQRTYDVEEDEDGSKESVHI